MKRFNEYILESSKGKNKDKLKETIGKVLLYLKDPNNNFDKIDNEDIKKRINDLYDAINSYVCTKDKNVDFRNINIDMSKKPTAKKIADKLKSKDSSKDTLVDGNDNITSKFKELEKLVNNQTKDTEEKTDTTELPKEVVKTEETVVKSNTIKELTKNISTTISQDDLLTTFNKIIKDTHDITKAPDTKEYLGMTIMVIGAILLNDKLGNKPDLFGDLLNITK